MATHITDLPVDIVKTIISAVAKAPDGARDVARSMLTCQLFLVASESNVVRRAVCFDRAQMLSRPLMFLNTDGLLFKCVSALNPSAEFHLAQIILTTSSQLLRLESLDLHREKVFRFLDDSMWDIADDDAFMASFITRFSPAPWTVPTPSQESDPRPLLYHWEFVRVFILKSTPMDILNMSCHVNNYITLFTGWQFFSADVDTFMRLLYGMLQVSYIESDTELVGDNLNDLWQSNIEGFCPVHGREVSMHTMDLFEYIRVRALHAFDVIIPKLI